MPTLCISPSRKVPFALCVPSLFLPLLVFMGAGCTPVHVQQPGHTALVPPNIGQNLSAKAQASFGFLQLEQAMRSDDLNGVLAASDLLLQVAPASQPLADAAGWLIGNRYTEQANTLLQKAVQALPDDLSLHLMLAESLQQSGNAKEALAMVKAYLKRHPNVPTAQLELALFFLKANQVVDALALLDSIPPAERNPTVRYYHAQALSMAGDPAGAAEQLHLALEEAPDFLEAMLELALVEEGRKNYAEARRWYKKILTYDQGNQDIMLRLVYIALLEGNPNQAFELATSMPDSFAFGMTAASLFMDEGRYDLALTLLNMLSQLPNAPEDLLFYEAVAEYDGNKNMAKAMELLDQISPENRYHDKSMRMRIQLFYELGNAEKALAVTHEARNIYSGEEDFWRMEIELLSALNRLNEALTVADEASTQWPDDTDLLFQKAYLLDQVGKKKDGLALMEEIIQLDPEHALALNYVGYTMAESGQNLPRALEMLLKATELAPRTSFILDSLAWAQYKVGQFDEAWQTIQQALLYMQPGDPDDPVMWEHVGDIAKACGKNVEAAQAWQRAARLLKANSPQATSLHTKLENLAEENPQLPQAVEGKTL